MKRLLLLSNSTVHGEGYLDWAEEAIRDFLGGRKRVLFVPYALADLDGYTRTARERLGRMGCEVRGAHEAGASLADADAVFTGGGNTFRLLTRVYESGLYEPLRRAVLEGLPYMGSSAGTNLACPTIKTTNDMPIVYPPTFDALGLIPFQINPHYLDPLPGSTHMGETREQRIREFHEMNEAPVLGLREGAWLRVDGEGMMLGGRNGARLFRRGAEPTEHAAGTHLTV